jgi:NADPH-dependent 2,4-dienoyl-CoA reductase/sulfur reductase-like enzyme
MTALAIVVLGAGPAGLAAAEAASANGQPVLLVDDNATPGGQIWRGGAPQWSDARAARLWQALTARPHVRMLFGARVVAAGAAGTLLLETADGPRTLHWQRLILCAGARELLLPFPGWTLPGVTGAGGMQALIKGGMPVAGKRVVVAGTGPLLLAVADTVQRHGGHVLAIAEQRGTRELARFGARLALRHRAKLAQALALLGGLRKVPYLRGALVRAASGEERLASVVIKHGERVSEIACDFLACGFGLVPALELAGLFGCAVEQDRVVVNADQRTSVDGVWAAGESTGIGGVDKALAEGRVAGLAAAGMVPAQAERQALAAALDFARLLAHSFAPAPALRTMCTPETMVCRCEDVRAADLAPHPGWRAAKLQTRVGMGPCQGRVCGAACAFLYGWEAAGARPPVFPASAITLASVPD